jgi:SAM-dependent methyltransferase
MPSSPTLDYYNTHAEEYARLTSAADMTDNYRRFLKYVPQGGTIADIGCGGGRDLRYFSDHGYTAMGIDASPQLCTIAHEYSGCPVTCTDFLAWTPDIRFDAFWANASLLHLPYDGILKFFRTKTQYLKTPGILYFTMKSDIPEGPDDKGRYFTPFSEALLEDILLTARDFSILDRWSNPDRLGRKDHTWQTIILGR